MKTVILYLLLLTYSTNLLKPVLPYITDTFSHIFWYSKHIATVHYENGKYHVHAEAINAAKKSESPNPAQTIKTETASSEHISSRIEYHFQLLAIVSVNYTSLPTSLTDQYFSGDYPPPRV